MVHAQDIDLTAQRHYMQVSVNVSSITTESHVVVSAVVAKPSDWTVILWASKVGQQVDEPQRARIALANLSA